MKQKRDMGTRSAEQTVRDIRRATRRQYSSEEKIRIVLEGLRGEESIAEGAVTVTPQIGHMLPLIDAHRFISPPSFSSRGHPACRVAVFPLSAELSRC